MNEGFMHNHYLTDNARCARMCWNQNVNKDIRKVILVDVWLKAVFIANIQENIFHMSFKETNCRNNT